jgi:hypothetical protein
MNISAPHKDSDSGHVPLERARRDLSNDTKINAESFRGHEN